MTQPKLIAAIGTAMRHLGERQRVIAQNVANSDTPGYKAREVAPPSFAGMVDAAEGGGVVRPTVQISDGMQRLGARSSSLTTIADTEISEVKPDGNNVTLEEQLLKMGQVQADYAALTNLYTKQMRMMKTALGKGGSV